MERERQRNDRLRGRYSRSSRSRQLEEGRKMREERRSIRRSIVDGEVRGGREFGRVG